MTPLDCKPQQFKATTRSVHSKQPRQPMLLLEYATQGRDTRFRFVGRY